MGNYFYSHNLISYLLLPFSAVYWFLYKLHRLLYSAGILKSVSVRVPVIVVGNLTVGGTGKTPLVAWLAVLLKQNGYRPGIISRGYGGKTKRPQKVIPNSKPSEVGDEACLLAKKTGLPVYVSSNRVAAANELLANNDCDVLISDDGLQHHRLRRDIEIIVIDGWRRFGNQFLLPAGPMRESLSRLLTVDYTLCRGGEPENGEIAYSVVAKEYRSLKSGDVVDADYFDGKKVHAVAAIGNPDQFFNLLKELGVNPIQHAYPDHYQFSGNEFNFRDTHPIIMTEKDAVKCEEFFSDNFWALVIQPKLPDDFATNILDRLKRERING